MQSYYINKVSGCTHHSFFFFLNEILSNSLRELCKCKPDNEGLCRRLFLIA